MMWIWFGVTLVLLIVEIVTTELVAIRFATSSLVLGLLAGFFPTMDIIWQILIFLALSAVLLFATRPLVKKLMKGSKDKENNLELMDDHEEIVVKEIQDNGVTVKIEKDKE